LRLYAACIWNHCYPHFDFLVSHPILQTSHVPNSDIAKIQVCMDCETRHSSDCSRVVGFTVWVGLCLYHGELAIFQPCRTKNRPERYSSSIAYSNFRLHIHSSKTKSTGLTTVHRPSRAR
jgi:hypothetical protein